MRRFLFTCASIMALSGGAQADKIKNPVAVFAGLDKITGRIIAFEASVDETVQFGSLQLTARICYSRPEYENPRTTTFLEVDEVSADTQYKRLFAGWMFADSPGLNAIEHPVYDVWLTDCRGGKEIIKTPPEQDEDPDPAPQPLEAKKLPPRPAQPTARGPGLPGEGNAPLALPGGNFPPGTLPPGAIPPGGSRVPPTQRFFPTSPGSGPRVYDPGPPPNR